MRVLYVMPAGGFGGAERQGVLHVAHLPRYGVDVIPAVGPSAAVCSALRAAGVNDLVPLPAMPDGEMPGGLRKAIRNHRAWVEGFSRSVGLVTRLARDADLIVANRTVGWLIAASVAKRTGIPYAIRAGSRPETPVAGPGLFAWLAATVQPEAVFVNCRAVGDSLRPWVRSPFILLPNAVDTAWLQPRSSSVAKEAFGFSTGHLVVGMAARPAPEKGFDLLAEVISRVVAALPGTTFAIAGEFPWRAAIQDQFRRRGVLAHARFLGHVDDVHAFFAACDVVVLTSRKRSIEGCPNALLEAMAMARPVVATDVGGVAEAVVDGATGFLCPAGDAVAFSRRLETLLRDASLRRRLGLDGRARVLRGFQIDRVIPRFAGELKRLLASRAYGNQTLVVNPEASTEWMGHVH